MIYREPNGLVTITECCCWQPVSHLQLCQMVAQRGVLTCRSGTLRHLLLDVSIGHCGRPAMHIDALSQSLRPRTHQFHQPFPACTCLRNPRNKKAFVNYTLQLSDSFDPL